MSTQVQHSTWRGVSILIVVTMIWGTTFVVVKQALDGIAASVLVTARFMVAMVMWMPWWRRFHSGLCRPALELGFWLVCCYGTQAVGLEYIPAGRSAFIAAMFVVLVPLWQWVKGMPPTRRQSLAVFIAFVGVSLLSFDGARPGGGDAITFLSAVSYAGYMFALERYACAHSDLELTMAQLAGVSVWGLIWIGVEGFAGTLTFAVDDLPWSHVLYLSVIATALTTWMQTAAQRLLGATRTAVLYMLEPVWAALFAWGMLGERPGWRGWCGGGAILLGTLLVEQSDEKGGD